MHVIVCGVGNIGSRVVALLHRLGERVTVIARSADESDVRNIRHCCVAVIAGDACDHGVLSAAPLREADALMVLTEDEVTNIDIAIAARDLAPDLKIIIRTFDEKFAKKIETGFRIDRALSTSSLASSSFVSACMNQSVQHAFHFQGRINYIAECRVHAGSPVAGISINDFEHAHAAKIIFHNASSIEDHLHAGDCLREGDSIIYSTFSRDSIARIDGIGENHPRRPIARDARRRGLLDRIRSIPRNIKIIGLLYMSLISAAVIVFHAGMNLSLLDALYFVLTTTTTVGYGDFNLQNAPVGIKLFGCLVMLCGAALLASIFSVITDALISKRFNQYFGIGKSRMKNHIVVAGLGNIGYRVINLLHQGGEKIISVEKNQDSPFLSLLRGRIPVIFGNALHPETMELAGIRNARTVMALTDDDLTNLNILLSAREINPAIGTVARIFNAGIGRKAREAFGIDQVLSTSAIAAPTFVSTAAHTGTICAFLVNDLLYALIEIGSEDYDFLHGETAAALTGRYRLYPFLYTGRDGISGFMRDGQTIRPDDRLILFGHYEDIKRLSGNAERGQYKKRYHY